MASKAEIVECVARATGMSKKDAGDAVDATCKCVARALAGGEKVQMPGFGTFVISHRAAREGRKTRTRCTQCNLCMVEMDRGGVRCVL